MTLQLYLNEQKLIKLDESVQGNYDKLKDRVQSKNADLRALASYLKANDAF